MNYKFFHIIKPRVFFQNFESRGNAQEPLEEKQKRFPVIYKEIGGDASMKKAFDGLDMGKVKEETLQVSDIAQAVEKQVTQGFQSSHLSREEKEIASTLLSKMKEQINAASSVKNAIEIYADFRTELISVIGTGNAKSAQPLKEYADSLKQAEADKKEQNKQFNFLEFARSIGASLVKVQTDRLERSIQAQNRSDREHAEQKHKALGEVLEKWPK